MGKMEKPQQVRDAILRGDGEMLRAMAQAGGVEGGKKSAQRADLRALGEAQRAEEFAQNERLYHVSEDGDVLPPDPNITN